MPRHSLTRRQALKLGAAATAALGAVRPGAALGRGSRQPASFTLAERLGYEIGAHDVVLHGRCPDCA